MFPPVFPVLRSGILTSPLMSNLFSLPPVVRFPPAWWTFWSESFCVSTIFKSAVKAQPVGIVSQCGTKPVQASVRQFTGLTGKPMCWEANVKTRHALFQQQGLDTTGVIFASTAAPSTSVCVSGSCSTVWTQYLWIRSFFDSCVNDSCSDGCFGYVTTLWWLAFWGHFCFSGAEMSGCRVLTKSSPSLCSFPLYVVSSSTSEAFIWKESL